MNIQTSGMNKRISVVGTTGSGKSYVSRLLAASLDLQVHELDELRDTVPGGQHNTEEFVTRVDQLTRLSEWVIDGHYVAIRHVIWQRAETVIFINYPLHIVFGQLIYR